MFGDCRRSIEIQKVSAETENYVYSFSDAGCSKEQNRVFSTGVGSTYDLLWLQIKRLQTDLKQDEQDISETTRFGEKTGR